MFSELILDNFKSFNHFKINFVENISEKRAKNLILVYGENGIGKSSIVDAFSFLKESFCRLENMKMFNNSLSKSDFKALISIFYDASDLKPLIDKYKRIDSEDNMVLSFESFEGDKKYLYSMSFNNKRVVEEKLTCNGDIIFKAGKKKLTLKSEHFTLENFNKRLQEYFQLYFGKHTVLACIHSLCSEIETSLIKKAISSTLSIYLGSILRLSIYSPKMDARLDVFDFPEINNRRVSSNLLQNFISGDLPEEKEKALIKTKNALSMYYSSLYSNIVSVDYQITSNRYGKKKYDLYFVEKNQDGSIVRIPYEKVSTGTKKLLDLFIYFYNVATTKKTVIIDEIDNGVNDILLKTIIDSLDESLEGQLIFTTHNTLLLDYKIKKNIYLLDRDHNDGVVAYSLNEFGRKIQPGTDVVGQYLKGLYGGIPQEGLFSMKYIVEESKNNE